VDWEIIAAMVDEKASGGAIVQHLSKIRERLKNEGHDVPPSIRKTGGRNSQGGATYQAFPTPSRNQEYDITWDEDVEMTDMTGDETDDTFTLQRRLPSQRKKMGPASGHRYDMDDSSNNGEDDDHFSTAMDTQGDGFEDDEIVGANDPEMRFDNSVEGWPSKHLPAMVQDTSENSQMGLAPFSGSQNNEQELSSHLDPNFVHNITTWSKNSSGFGSMGNPQDSSLIISFPVSLIDGVPILRNKAEVMPPPQKKKKLEPKGSGESKPSASTKMANESTRPTKPTRPSKPTRPTKPTSSTKKTQPVITNAPATVPAAGHGEQINAFGVPHPRRRYDPVLNDPMNDLMFNIGDDVGPPAPYFGSGHESSTSYNFNHTAPMTRGDDIATYALARKRKEHEGFNMNLDNPPAGTICPLAVPTGVRYAEEAARDAQFRKRLMERSATDLSPEEIAREAMARTRKRLTERRKKMAIELGLRPYDDYDETPLEAGEPTAKELQELCDYIIDLEDSNPGYKFAVSDEELGQGAPVPVYSTESYLANAANAVASNDVGGDLQSTSFVDFWGNNRPLDDYFGDALWGMELVEPGTQLATDTGETTVGENLQSNQVEPSQNIEATEGQDSTNGNSITG
jgi:hypothetical protein